jgi:methyltransferase
MGEAAVLLGFVTVQRLCELVWSRANSVRLIARGGREFGMGHYPWLVALHMAWLGGLWILAYDRGVSRGWLAVFVALQAGRVWVLASLGRRWSTRVIVLPGEPLVRRGPYALMNHPNYLIVAGEIAVVPLALGLPVYALLFSLLNAAILVIRIRVESRALAWGASVVGAAYASDGKPAAQ